MTFNFLTRMEPYDEQSNIQEKIQKVRQLLKGEVYSFFCDMQCLLTELDS